MEAGRINHMNPEELQEMLGIHEKNGMLCRLLAGKHKTQRLFHYYRLLKEKNRLVIAEDGTEFAIPLEDIRNISFCAGADILEPENPFRQYLIFDITYPSKIICLDITL